jgi:hypothetical protein
MVLVAQEIPGDPGSLRRSGTRQAQHKAHAQAEPGDFLSPQNFD